MNGLRVWRPARGLFWLAGLLAAMLSWGKAEAADPQLGRTTPWGAQRGTEVDIILTGARLKDAQELLLYFYSIALVLEVFGL